MPQPRPEIHHSVPQYTLEVYETDFADRHLVHGAPGKWAREAPDHVAFIDSPSRREYTYRQFDETTTALAMRLLELGLRPGDFLATQLPLLPQHILLEYACFKIGVIHTPLDVRLKAPEVVRLMKLVEPKVFAFSGRADTTQAESVALAVREACAFVQHFVQFSSEGAEFPESISGEALLSQVEATGTSTASTRARNLYQEATTSVRPTDGAQVIFTTGSTGLPKPALLSHRNITCQNMCLAGGFEFTRDTRTLVNLPPSHVGCQAEELMTTFFGGGTAVIVPVFDAEESLRAIQDHRVNCFGQVPAMFQLQWRLPNFREYDLSSVHKVLFGGQQVTRPFVEQLVAMVPRAATGLGLTEMAGFVTYTPITSNVDELVDNVGWPMPVTPLSIRQPMQPDGTAGEVVAEGQVGEICFRGPQVFSGYVNDPEAYRRTVSREGICYTGDLGVMSDRGLIFKGRSKLVIKPKGYQVHPAEIENHFAALNDLVAACGAVGAPHEVFSEGVVLFVERRPGATVTREQLELHARGIASYMRPLHYVLIGQGAFPLNRVAKTDYARLRELAQIEIQQLRAGGGWDR